MSVSLLSPTLFTLVSNLTSKSVLGEAPWITEGSAVRVNSPSGIVVLERAGDESEEAITLSIFSPNGMLSGAQTFSPGESGFNDVANLYNIARQAGLENIVKGILADMSSGRITASAHPPQLPDRPSVSQAEKFFSRIEGNWHLDYGHGREAIHIDSLGNLFVLSLKDGKPAATTARPKFRLELLRCNSELSDVEIAKVESNGRTFQIEILLVESDRMTGTAKHDGHRLRYTRQT